MSNCCLKLVEQRLAKGVGTDGASRLKLARLHVLELNLSIGAIPGVGPLVEVREGPRGLFEVTAVCLACQALLSEQVLWPTIGKWLEERAVRAGDILSQTGLLVDHRDQDAIEVLLKSPFLYIKVVLGGGGNDAHRNAENEDGGDEAGDDQPGALQLPYQARMVLALRGAIHLLSFFLPTSDTWQ